MGCTVPSVVAPWGVSQQQLHSPVCDRWRTDKLCMQVVKKLWKQRRSWWAATVLSGGGCCCCCCCCLLARLLVCLVACCCCCGCLAAAWLLLLLLAIIANLFLLLHSLTGVGAALSKSGHLGILASWVLNPADARRSRMPHLFLPPRSNPNWSGRLVLLLLLSADAAANAAAAATHGRPFGWPEIIRRRAHACARAHKRAHALDHACLH